VKSVDRHDRKVVPVIRVSPGYYATDDGRFEILRGDRGCPWSGLWLVRETRTRGNYTDPMRTLAEAREALNAMVEDRDLERGVTAVAEFFASAAAFRAPVVSAAKRWRVTYVLLASSRTTRHETLVGTPEDVQRKLKEIGPHLVEWFHAVPVAMRCGHCGLRWLHADTSQESYCPHGPMHDWKEVLL
jgi:hypothetical protein